MIHHGFLQFEDGGPAYFGTPDRPLWICEREPMKTGHGDTPGMAWFDFCMRNMVDVATGKTLQPPQDAISEDRRGKGISQIENPYGDVLDRFSRGCLIVGLVAGFIGGISAAWWLLSH